MIYAKSRIMADQKEIGERLKQARINAGFGSVAEAAESLGIKYQTYAAHENGNRGLLRELATYARRYNVSTDWLLRGKGQGPNAAPANNNSDNLPEITKPIDRVAVVGKVSANTWLDVDEMDFDQDDVEFVPSISGYPISAQFALRIDGKCLNKVADHNDILICVKSLADGVEIRENDLVIVERRRFGGQMVERTAKRLRITSRGQELWPESTDPAHQEPIVLYDKPGGVDIDIIGKVLWILRKP
jgi:transcriptional regulator with XRE-family HTH domain